jgi:hypothetical protein
VLRVDIELSAACRWTINRLEREAAVLGKLRSALIAEGLTAVQGIAGRCLVTSATVNFPRFWASPRGLKVKAALV